MKFFSLIPVIAIGGLLIWAAQDFPQWGDDESPASKSPVSSHFIGSTGVDTEVPNMVTAVLADYRGFDTMFETVVVFIARTCCHRHSSGIHQREEKKERS